MDSVQKKALSRVLLGTILFLLLNLSTSLADTIPPPGFKKLTKEELIEKLKQKILQKNTGDEIIDASNRSVHMPYIVEKAGADNVVDVLLWVADDKYADVRMMAFEGLGQCKSKDPNIRNALLRGLADDQPRARLFAAAALIKRDEFPDEKDSVVISIAMGKSSDKWEFRGLTQKKFLEEAKLQEKENRNGSTKDERENLLVQFRIAARSEAIRLLAKIKTSNAANALNALKRDANDKIRNRARLALDEM